MKIEIKNVKYSQFASRETNFFEATVYIDGKRMGTVSNDGHGGPNNYDSRALVEALTEHTKTLPTRTWQLDGEALEVPPDIDTAIDDLLMAYLYARDLKRDLSKRVLFVDKDGILKQTRTMAKPELEATLRAPDLGQRLRSNRILNMMPFDVALTTYREVLAAGA
jgi:hypothetical protein